MIPDDAVNAINDAISSALRVNFRGVPAGQLGGGCINQATRFTDERTGSSVFVKWNRADLLPMFETEAMGLDALDRTQAIRVPKPICCGRFGQQSFLVLEWIAMRSDGDWFAMGQQLAALHRAHCHGSFGWEQDNFIGTTPQRNPPTDDWDHFFSQARLAYQVELAETNGGRFPRFRRLLDLIPAMLAGHDLRPSLVHGDLWSGNAAFDQAGQPVLFDPATYRGDREVDLAMSTFFGGFPTEFYNGYHEAFPLRDGYLWRRTLYNLYHALNHFNLFGGHYEGQANQMIQQLLAEA